MTNPVKWQPVKDTASMIFCIVLVIGLFASVIAAGYSVWPTLILVGLLLVLT